LVLMSDRVAQRLTFDRPVFVSDIVFSPELGRTSEPFVLQSGLRAPPWSTPHHGRTTARCSGTFCMYYREVRHPKPGRNSADRLRPAAIAGNRR